MLETIKKIKSVYLKWSSKIALYLIGLFIILIILFIFMQVILRYIFNTGLRWPHELSGFLFVWVCFVGPIFPFEQNELIKITFFRERLPNKFRLIIELLIYLIVLITLFLLIYHGFRSTQQVWSRTTPALRFSYGYVYLSLPLGFSLLFIAYFLEFIENLILKIPQIFK